ncbi:MAG: DUF3021 domain-containing protein [Coriobacteriales bacterium]|jgi:hypothetical protein|nr:DUF3021 domain-containing protein [Coriobacteriales bacterium]
MNANIPRSGKHDGHYDGSGTAGSRRLNNDREHDAETSLRKSAISRTLLGFPLGMTIGVIFVLATSFAAGDGRLHPVTPALLQWMPDELTATFWQFILCGVLGAICSGSSILFEIEHWSLARQTAVHFLLMVGSLISIASVCGWTSPTGFSLLDTVIYLAISVLVYLIIWFCMYLYWWKWTKAANRRLGA